MKRLQAIAILGAAAAPQAARAQSQAPYKIGVTWPLTGPFAPAFSDYLKGQQLAVEDVNRSGGIKGRPVQTVIEDTQGTPQSGIAAMRKLVQVDGVQCIITILTNVVTAQIPLADELKIPTISTVETPGLFAKAEYSFGHAPTWGLTLPMMVSYWKEHGVKRIFAMLTNNAIGNQQSDAVRRATASFAQYEPGLIEQGGTDFRGTVERAKDMPADIILITGQGGQHEIAAIKEIREMGLRTPIWNLGQNFTSGPYRQAIGPYSEGLIYGGVYLDPKTSPAFVKRYKAAVGYVPGYPAATNYDEVKIYAAGIAKNGYSGPAIREFVASLKGFPSALGSTITMGSDHFTEFGNSGVFVVKNGTLVRFLGHA